MKTAIELLQEKNAVNSPSLLEEVSGLKATVTTLHESSVKSQVMSEQSANAPTWSEVVKRKHIHPGGKRTGGRGKDGKGGSEQGGLKQGSVPKEHAPSKTKGKNSSRQFQPLPGKHKVWGT